MAEHSLKDLIIKLYLQGNSQAQIVAKIKWRERQITDSTKTAYDDIIFKSIDCCYVFEEAHSDYLIIEDIISSNDNFSEFSAEDIISKLNSDSKIQKNKNKLDENRLWTPTLEGFHLGIRMFEEDFSTELAFPNNSSFFRYLEDILLWEI